MRRRLTSAPVERAWWSPEDPRSCDQVSDPMIQFDLRTNSLSCDRMVERAGAEAVEEETAWAAALASF